MRNNFFVLLALTIYSIYYFIVLDNLYMRLITCIFYATMFSLITYSMRNKDERMRKIHDFISKRKAFYLSEFAKFIKLENVKAAALLEYYFNNHGIKYDKKIVRGRVKYYVLSS